MRAKLFASLSEYYNKKWTYVSVGVSSKNQKHQRSFQLAYTLLIASILYQALVSIQFVLGKRKHIIFFAKR